ncbi:MAG: hypothetical protein HYY23_00335 [Verrucomicrobia bacterium]|nr:hypothetical protein [Verrucomicrobiota bacterium]
MAKILLFRSSSKNRETGFGCLKRVSGWSMAKANMTKTLVFSALGLLILAFGFTWLVTFVRYRITPRHFKVTLLGITLRRIRLEDIESVTKRRRLGLAENWWNTLHPSHRTLVIRRNRGLIKNIVITPRNRYVFKTNLEKAIQQKDAPAEDTAERVFVVTD